jgi:hypothetical protein
VTLPPWEYLFLSFNSHNFHDLFHPTWISAILLLAALVILYDVRTRQLRHHPPFLELYEWLLWTGIIFFAWLIICSLFVFDFFLVLGGEIVGVGVFLWIRFFRFPPLLEAYERQLAKQRYFDRRRFSKPETTIRAKPTRPARQARQKRRRRR